MICENCGSEIAPGAPACGFCGEAITASPSHDRQQHDQPPPVQSKPVQPPGAQTMYGGVGQAVSPGTAAAGRCGSCGAEIEPEAVFCGSCGKPVTQPAKYTPPPQPQQYAPKTVPSHSSVQPAAGHCGNCGAEIEPDSMFCAACGTKVQGGSRPPKSPKSFFPISKKLIGIIACAVALAGVLIVVLSIISAANNPENILKNYITATIRGDYGTIVKHHALNIDALIDEMIKASDMSKSEFYDELYEREDVRSFQEFMEKQLQDSREVLEDEVGQNIRITYDVREPKKLTKRQRESKIEDLQSSFDRMDISSSKIVNFKNITEMTEYKVRITITGSEDEKSNTATFVLAKIDGQWRVWDAASLFSGLFSFY